MSRKSLDRGPRRSFSWQRRRNPNPCAPPTLNPPSDCWLAERPLGAPQAVAFQTSTVASAAVVECTPPKKPCQPPSPSSRTHIHTWVPLPPHVLPHHWLGTVSGEGESQNCNLTSSSFPFFVSALRECVYYITVHDHKHLTAPLSLQTDIGRHL